ncbi:MAG: hypothetical protein QOI63_800 [Thermoplasmata archaeon]|jgi:hypothetical protein|nr:hypothetical protein [Thermoplasmata archaeon]
MSHLPRTCLILAIAALLAGCAGKQAPIHQQVPAPMPQAVAIHGELNLTTGVSAQSWSFKVMPGLRTGHVTFTLQGLDGQPVRGKAQACLHYTVIHTNGSATTEASSGDCPTGPNAIVQPPLAVGEDRLVDWNADKMPPGTYDFQFNAAPQVGRLVVDIAADYLRR